MSSLAIHREGETLMFDCGEGTQRQMMRYGVSFALEDIFFTHMHADHLLGVIGLMRTMALQGRTERLRLWGPRGSKRVLKRAEALGFERTTFPVEILELEPGNASSEPATRSSRSRSTTAARRRSATRSSRKTGRDDSIRISRASSEFPKARCGGRSTAATPVTLARRPRDRAVGARRAASGRDARS